MTVAGTVTVTLMVTVTVTLDLSCCPLTIPGHTARFGLQTLKGCTVLCEHAVRKVGCLPTMLATGPGVLNSAPHAVLN